MILSTPSDAIKLSLPFPPIRVFISEVMLLPFIRSSFLEPVIFSIPVKLSALP